MTVTAYYNPNTASIDVDGLTDRRTGIKYLGQAKRDEFGRWVCLAIVGGVGLCKVELRLEPADGIELTIKQTSQLAGILE